MGILDDAIREHLELKRRHGADSQEVSRQEREILGGGGDADPADAQAPPSFDDAPAYDEAPAYDAPAYDAPPAPAAAAIPEPLHLDPPVADPVPVPEPLSGSPLSGSEPTRPVDDLFPGTGELLAAASETPPAAPAAPSRPLAAPAPADADSETTARSGARRLSDDELAAWRRRLSERADRLAAQRPGGLDAAAAAGTGAAAPAPEAPKQAEPPSYWSGNRTGADAGTPPATPAPRDTAQHGAVPPTPPVSGVPVDFFDAGDAAESAFAPEAAPEPVAPDHDVLDETPEFLEETPEHDRMWFEQRPPRDFDFG